MKGHNTCHLSCSSVTSIVIYKSKMQKSAETCQQEDVIFVTQSFGGWHEVDVERIGTALAVSEAPVGQARHSAATRECYHTGK